MQARTLPRQKALLVTGGLMQQSLTPRIDITQPTALETWAVKLDATPEQIREAVQAVGDHPEDVELHLKGSRSTTNSERVASSGVTGR
ncbi:MAG: DUF3606 domain-containing protein [Aquabacterium sp.]